MNYDHHLDKVEKVLGLKIGQKLGSGAYGSVYDVEGKRALKFTMSHREAKLISKIQDLRAIGYCFPDLPIYEDIFKLGLETYLILREAVEPIEEDGEFGCYFLEYEEMTDKGNLLKRFPNTYKELKKVGIGIWDVKNFNIGTTIEKNEYRNTGDEVLFDFMPASTLHLEFSKKPHRI